jgi:hypothetical protein
MRMLRLPTARPLALRFLRATVTSWTPFLSLASGSWSCFRDAWALVFRFRHLLRFFLFWRKTVGSLKFPGYPFVLLPCSRTPVGSPRQAFYGVSILPPIFRLRRLQLRSLFRGSITRLSHRSIRFVPPSLTTTQCSLPAGGHPLPGGLLIPLGPCFVFPSLAFGFDYMIFLTFWVYLTRLNPES